MLRPMRPNPLIATLIVMLASSLEIMGSEHLVSDRLGRDPEVPVKILVGGARPETLHADEDAVLPDERVPAEAHGGLDRDLDRRITNDPAADWFGLGEEEVERGHGDDAGREASLVEKILRRERNLDLAAGGEDGGLRAAIDGADLISAGCTEI